VKQRSLKTLRLEIDAIDDKIHNLLMSRVKLVGEVGKVKAAAGDYRFSLRPAREASMMRRLVNQHRGPFPADSLIKIWRELLCGTVRVQTPFSVALCEGDDPIESRGLVRDQFSNAPTHIFATPENTIESVQSGESMVAVVPVPNRSTESTWWHELAFGKHKNLKIIGLLPFLRSNASPSSKAFSIAEVRPESSGRDTSLVVLEYVTGEPNVDFLEQTETYKILGQLAFNGRQPGIGKTTALLVSTQKFIEHPDQVKTLLPPSLQHVVTRFATIGCYPEQLDIGRTLEIS
tara:strand:- start:315 stop:1184 length:870 start_codon:yes stop_codon:yes gene_type:complete